MSISGIVRQVTPSSHGAQVETPAGDFHTLLARLSTDESKAAAEYECLRRRLLVYFQGRGCSTSDACADETLDRVGRRLAQGERIDHVARYTYGVARRIATEE